MAAQDDRNESLEAEQSERQSGNVGQTENALTKDMLMKDALTEDAPADAADARDARAEEGQTEDAQMNAMIEQLCISKAEEFQLIGYEHVSGQDVWECISDKYHKKGIPPLYQVVNDILSLKVTQFMNYITLSMYRGDRRG